MAKNGKARTSRIEHLIVATAQDVGQLSTPDILRKRDVIVCEIEAIEAEMNEMATRTAAAKPRRAKLEATLAGITLAINRRQICE